MLEKLSTKVKLVGGAILGVIALIVAFLFERSKRQSAEALLENQETKEALLAKDKEIIKHEAVLEHEAKERESIEKEEIKDVDTKELVDFFKDHKDKK